MPSQRFFSKSYVFGYGTSEFSGRQQWQPRKNSKNMDSSCYIFNRLSSVDVPKPDHRW